MNLQDRVLKALKNNVRTSKNISLNTRLNELIVDSVDKRDIIDALENEFSIILESDELNKIRTVSDIVDKFRLRMN